MKKKYSYPALFFLLSILAVLSGCDKTVIVVSDPYWEKIVDGNKNAPDWKGLLKKNRYKPIVLTTLPSEEEWTSLLAESEPEFILWGPLWVEESSDFSKVHREIRSLMLFPRGKDQEIPDNVTHCVPLRLEAYRQIAQELGERAGPEGRVVSVFYTGSDEREDEFDIFTETLSAFMCEKESVTFRRQENYQKVLDFFDKNDGKECSYLFISAGGRTSDIYDKALKEISGTILVETPDLSKKTVEENPSIMHYQWEELLQEIFNTDLNKWKEEYNVSISIKID